MTPEQVDLIRRSFDAIWPVRRKLAGLFYSRFFELAPDAKHLFPNDMERQHLKLMDMIAAIVGALDKRELFQSIIRHTGRQHGVKSSHFVAFGDALIWSLESNLVRHLHRNLKTPGSSSIGMCKAKCCVSRPCPRRRGDRIGRSAAIRMSLFWHNAIVRGVA
jgi:hemoglobin-like flavoprotein